MTASPCEWIYGTLTTLDESGQPQPGLAESWELDDEAGTLTLHLQEGLEFSDGTPYDAEAVAAGLNYLKTGEQTERGPDGHGLDAEAVDDVHRPAQPGRARASASRTSFSQREGMIPAPSTYDIDDPDSSAGRDRPRSAPARSPSSVLARASASCSSATRPTAGPDEYGFDTLELTQVGVGNPAVNALRRPASST